METAVVDEEPETQQQQQQQQHHDRCVSVDAGDCSQDVSLELSQEDDRLSPTLVAVESGRRSTQGIPEVSKTYLINYHYL